jgi:tRNA-specific 2-thiouridylase
MSGGVDSAVAAARAAEAGHDVTGVHLALSRNPSSYRSGARGCCTLEDARDARRAADVIGIPFYVWDLAERFHADVVQDFVDEYARGNTPNPCLRCNEKIKFAAVLDRAVALGFDAVCTGHHARLRPAQTDAPAGPGAARQRADSAGSAGTRLARSVDQAKDQSYVLAVLTGEQLARAMFPLGDSTKDEVRKEAAERGLAVADKPDSHDVCFIADGDTRKFLTRQLGSVPGPIVEADGTVVGSHDGAFGFTVGQRRGLRIGRPAADGRPRYVLDIEPVSGTVTVGPAESLDVLDIEAHRPVWTGCPAPAGELKCLVQLRAHGEQYPATAWLDGGALRIRLDRPARGIARGQAAVLYEGDLVLGSATITGASTITRAPRAGQTTKPI